MGTLRTLVLEPAVLPSSPLAPMRLTPALRVAPLTLLLLSAAAPAAHGQGGPGPLAPGGLAVTPDGGTEPGRAINGNYSAMFTVTNPGGVAITPTFSCGRTGQVATCATDPNTDPIDPISVPAGSSISWMVTYTTAGVAGNGTVTLTATNAGASDQGFYNVIVLGPGAPGLVLKNHNRDNVDRGMCLTVGGAGEAAGVGCGQLFVAHGTPAYSTMGKSRSLTLLYNSAQAMPGAVVAATVTMPLVQQPTALYMELKVATAPSGALVIRDSATYNTAGWGGTIASQPRQVVLWFADTTLATGIYPFTLSASNQYAGSNLTTTVADTMLVVNRAASEYAAGWSLGGVEQLYFLQPVGTTKGDILWVGGDGSARWYRKLDATHWLAPAGEFRDTLALSAGLYTRTLRHGIQVVFDAAGRHWKTVNRTLQTSRFHWTAAGKLDSIIVPPSPASGPVTPGTAYRLAYDGNGKLDRITDPAGRILDATITGNRLLSLVDPDTTIATTFLYGQAGAFPTLLTRRTTRRGFAANITYQGSLVTQATFPHDTTATALETTGYTHWNTTGWTAHPHSSQQTAADTLLAHTVVQGPRTGLADSAAFWVDRWGAPVKVKDALGNSTTMSRGNPTTPALITRVVTADGKVDSLTYNARGNLLKDSTAYPDGLPPSVTRWTYTVPLVPDSPDSVIDPVGLKSAYSYNSWGLDSTARAPNGHVTRFEYLTTGSLAGLVRAVWDRSVTTWDTVLTRKTVLDSIHTAFVFDGLGNVLADSSPTGRVRTMVRDGAGRVTDLTDPGGHHTGYVYDAANRVRQQLTYPLSGAPDVTTLSYRIDALRQVADPRGVTRGYRSDPSGRVIGEVDDYGALEQRFYSPAGQLESVQQRNGDVIRREYDAAGQLRKLAWPARSVAHAGLWGAAADSIAYGYDVMGRLLTARLASGDSITRTYYATGLLQTEVARHPGMGLISVGYSYDLAGRRSTLRIGTPGVAAARDSVWYAYDSTGLRKMVVLWRGSGGKDSVRFWWDGLGRRDSLRYLDGTINVGLGYDADGGLRYLCADGPGNGLLDVQRHVNRVDADRHPRRVNQTMATTCQSPLAPDTMAYDVRHQLVLRDPGASPETWTYDASGNRVDYTKPGSSTHDSILPGHNRLLYTGPVGGPNRTWYTYDANGARGAEAPCTASGCDSTGYGTVAYIYDGQGRSTGRYTWLYLDQGGAAWSGASCDYDVLGRQRQTCSQNPLSLGYDGNNVVRTAADPDQGWTFIHGPGTDDPLFSRSTVYGAKFAYITDGQGRQYAVATYSGTMPGAYNGLQAAGGTTNATSFGATRQPSADMPGISFFRNRWYDQATGRWTQEDPIGIAGGLNLYQFNGNNPATYTDPFGLCPKDKGGDGKTDKLDDCPRHSEGWKEHLKAEDAKAQRRECEARNTAWMKSDNALVAGVVGVGGSVTAIGTGLLAKAQGTQLVAQGTVELDLFFATPKASSALVENGIATRAAGTALVNKGAGLLKGGGVVLAAQATLGAAYLATTIAACNVNPDR